jgi:hypothetical protein
MKPRQNDEAEALRIAIGQREVQLEHALSDLVAAAEARASLGHYVARYPWQFLLGDCCSAHGSVIDGSDR